MKDLQRDHQPKLFGSAKSDIWGKKENLQREAIRQKLKRSFNKE